MNENNEGFMYTFIFIFVRKENVKKCNQRLLFNTYTHVITDQRANIVKTNLCIVSCMLVEDSLGLSIDPTKI